MENLSYFQKMQIKKILKKSKKEWENAINNMSIDDLFIYKNTLLTYIDKEKNELKKSLYRFQYDLVFNRIESYDLYV